MSKKVPVVVGKPSGRRDIRPRCLWLNRLNELHDSSNVFSRSIAGTVLAATCGSWGSGGTGVVDSARLPYFADAETNSCLKYLMILTKMTYLKILYFIRKLFQ